MPEEFYEVLGVDEDAAVEEIKRAYRGKVRQYHPDVNDDERAVEQFRAVKRAYETLSNPERRKAYDRLGHEAYVEKRLGNGSAGGDAGPGKQPEERRADRSGGDAANGRESAGDRTASQASAPGGSSSSADGGTATAGAAAGGTAGARDARNRGARSVGGRPDDGRRARHDNRNDGPRRAHESATVGGRGERERAHVRRQMRRRRVVSRYGEPALYGAALATFAGYVVGLAAFVEAAVADATLTALTAGDVGAVLAGNGIESGYAFAAASAAARSTGLLFPVGAALLPVVLLAAVNRLPARWRHPAWWLLPVVGLGPAAGLALQCWAPGAATPATVAVGLYGVAPVAAALGWLGLVLSRL